LIQHPWKKDSIEGATIIYELPYQDAEGNVPPGAYIIGCDPFRDNTEGGDSYATIYVLKTNKYPSTVGHNELVATYVGRPYNGVNQINETLHKLSLFYGNATIYFENAVSNIKEYFEKSFFNNKDTAFDNALDYTIEAALREGLDKAMKELNFTELVAAKAKELLSEPNYIAELAEAKVRSSLGLPSKP